MTKKKAIIIGLVLVFVLVVISQLMPLFSNPKTFVLEDYVSEIAQYGSELNVGKITDEADALAKAESVWISQYGQIVLKQRPYKVKTDPITKTYLIQGTLPKGSAGGIAMIILDSTGRVLALWHTN